ncbi:hypothetical protein MJO28_007737 [Puccinia striiformis f. sp. tritici]|uniref:Uncharacterized protein n=1 Tax=Puccinia striiformis f. sp. tritici TaxID=168172 RepID=A0ACC0EEQ5_9BASI|nr:hypothetical protein MJO29_016877 [Puccinia striiformis f. sp. tritici]KAI7952053.1 hypothetical protein MJO28_007737 [Puccinia striiformis f. sp. tritici]KAI7956271.1 hypothetical protein MJO29_007670 [Puccinia striiformis f. sp. tritici]
MQPSALLAERLTKAPPARNGTTPWHSPQTRHTTRTRPLPAVQPQADTGQDVVEIHRAHRRPASLPAQGCRFQQHLPQTGLRWLLTRVVEPHLIKDLQSTDPMLRLHASIND